MSATRQTKRVEQFRSNADFTLAWAPHLVAEEMRRLIGNAELDGETPSWRNEVTLLLQQAFTTDAPSEEFENVRRSNSSNYLTASDEEPF